jgi:hypothetical protein
MAYYVILVLRNCVQYAHACILAVTSCTIDAVIVDMQSAQCTSAFFISQRRGFSTNGVHCFSNWTFTKARFC